MKVIILSLFLIITFFVRQLHAESYQDCILKNMKDVNDRLSAAQIMYSCLDKTTPKKCRQHLAHNRIKIEPNGRYSLEQILSSDEYLRNCLKECEEANIYVRIFGDCSTE